MCVHKVWTNKLVVGRWNLIWFINRHSLSATVDRMQSAYLVTLYIIYLYDRTDSLVTVVWYVSHVCIYITTFFIYLLARRGFTYDMYLCNYIPIVVYSVGRYYGPVFFFFFGFVCLFIFSAHRRFVARNQIFILQCFSFNGILFDFTNHKAQRRCIDIPVCAVRGRILTRMVAILFGYMQN